MPDGAAGPDGRRRSGGHRAGRRAAGRGLRHRRWPDGRARVRQVPGGVPGQRRPGRTPAAGVPDHRGRGAGPSGVRLPVVRRGRERRDQHVRHGAGPARAHRDRSPGWPLRRRRRVHRRRSPPAATSAPATATAPAAAQSVGRDGGRGEPDHGAGRGQGRGPESVPARSQQRLERQPVLRAGRRQEVRRRHRGGRHQDAQQIHRAVR